MSDVRDRPGTSRRIHEPVRFNPFPEGGGYFRKNEQRAAGSVEPPTILHQHHTAIPIVIRVATPRPLYV